MGQTTLKGVPVKIGGDEINVGDFAPSVAIIGKNLEEITVGGAKGVKQILVVVPSLDTEVCAAETRRFNAEAAKDKNTQVTVVSMDVPFAMGRFCSVEGIENLNVGSDFRDKAFAKAYGVLIEDGLLSGFTCRAVFVIDGDGKVSYKEIVAEITDEPNYEAILSFAT
ncbi:thiol peroxidase [Sulfurospirillum sp. T05]|uniref:Thiol peroxidase n=1 Tax=Sulfurospirillum tamanense TaxID=2813362 RepID=A0ABS2WVC3_9BACT|nr:thiol peroxidase [Sulfurospirillum tamanensis]MBN2965601.1 thiol peroxidase [Sulfurospirillum tamanensis]